MEPANTARIEAQTREQTLAWLESVIEMVKKEPGAPQYPLSVLLLASSLDENSSKLHWMTLADVDAGPDRPNGWAQALYLSRDLLTVLARLDHDYKLGLKLLPAVIAAHPLFQGRVKKGEGRTVTDFVQDKATGGNNGSH